MLNADSVGGGRLTAWMLALAGFVPFAVLAAALIGTGKASPLHGLLIDAFRTWGAIILSFLGGTRWGLILSGRDFGALALVPTIAPALVGWAALFLPPALGITVLLLAFCSQGAWDSIAFHRQESMHWFARLRILLTLLVAAAHLLALLSFA